MALDISTQERISILEEEILKSGRAIGRASFYVDNLNIQNRSQIREWLRLNRMNERAIAKATDHTLATAFRAGERYIAKVNEGEAKRLSVSSSKRNFRLNDLDIDLSGNDTVKDLLSQTLDEQEKPKDFGGSNQTQIQNPSSSSGSNVKIDEAAIARAAAAVIGPRVSAARDELKAEVRKSVLEAAAAFTIGPKAQAQITDLATEVATSKINELLIQVQAAHAETVRKLEGMIPTRIEVKTSTTTRLLKPEPRHEVFPDVLESLLLGEHVYLVGEAGTGKTHMFKQLGEALGRPTTILGQTLTKYEFSGHLGPTGEYVTTLLRKAVEEGHLLAIDEIDISAAAAIAFLNSLTANRFIAFPDRMVEAHPDFMLIAAANTYGFGATTQYVGRNPLDAASLDRFNYIECHYDENLERTLYGDTPWTSYVHKVRAATRKLELQHIISMRAIDRGRRLLANGRDPAYVCKKALWRNLNSDTVSRIESIAGTFRQLKEVA